MKGDGDIMVGTLWSIELKQSGGGKFYVKLHVYVESEVASEGSGWSPNEAYQSAVRQLWAEGHRYYLPKELQVNDNG
jgi:hypothetical protein